MKGLIIEEHFQYDQLLIKAESSILDPTKPVSLIVRHSIFFAVDFCNVLGAPQSSLIDLKISPGRP